MNFILNILSGNDLLWENLEYMEINSNIEFENTSIINKADWHSSHIASFLSNGNHNPYLGETKTIEALEFKLNIQERFKNLNGATEFNISRITLKNLDNQIIEDSIYIGKPEGRYVLRLFEEPRSMRLHAHELFLPTNNTNPENINHIEKVYNPMPGLKKYTPFYRNGIVMSEGIPFRFDSDWPLEIKNKYWFATECNKRSFGEKQLLDAYSHYEGQSGPYESMYKQACDREKTYLYNRDKTILELQSMISNLNK